MTYRRWLSTIFCLLLATAAVIAALMAAVFYMVRQPDFPHKIQDPSLVAQETAFTFHHRDCQVLIYGDSTAWNGVDPQTITDHTGLSACNIAVSRPVIDALGSAPLDTFLANNPKPRFLILQYGPEVFYRNTSWEHIGAYFPLVMLMRDFPVHTAVWNLIQHPAQDVQLLNFLLVQKFHSRPADFQRREDAFNRSVAASRAHIGRLSRYDPEQTTCAAHPIELFGPLDSRWAQGLRDRYTARGMTVLIVAAPLTECDPQTQKFRKDLAPLVDVNVDIFPSSISVDQRHPSPDGAPTVTLHLIPYLKCRIDKTPCPVN